MTDIEKNELIAKFHTWEKKGDKWENKVTGEVLTPKQLPYVGEDNEHWLGSVRTTMFAKLHKMYDGDSSKFEKTEHFDTTRDFDVKLDKVVEFILWYNKNNK